MGRVEDGWAIIFYICETIYSVVALNAPWCISRDLLVTNTQSSISNPLGFYWHRIQLRSLVHRIHYWRFCETVVSLSCAAHDYNDPHFDKRVLIRTSLQSQSDSSMRNPFEPKAVLRLFTPERRSMMTMAEKIRWIKPVFNCQHWHGKILAPGTNPIRFKTYSCYSDSRAQLAVASYIRIITMNIVTMPLEDPKNKKTKKPRLSRLPIMTNRYSEANRTASINVTAETFLPLLQLVPVYELIPVISWNCCRMSWLLRTPSLVAENVSKSSSSEDSDAKSLHPDKLGTKHFTSSRKALIGIHHLCDIRYNRWWLARWMHYLTAPKEL